MTIPQSEITDFCQPCRARAPFVRFADISPDFGGIHPLHKGAFGGSKHPTINPVGAIQEVNCPKGAREATLGCESPANTFPFGTSAKRIG